MLALYQNMKQFKNIDEFTVLIVLLFVMGFDGLFEDTYTISKIIDVIAIVVSVWAFIMREKDEKKI